MSAERREDLKNDFDKEQSTMILTAIAGIAALQATPGPLAGHSMVFSKLSGGVLLMGGDSSGKAPIFRLVGGNWVAIAGSESSNRSLAAVAADDAGNVLVHGGSIATPNQNGQNDYRVSAETWLWNGISWKVVATSGPAPRDHHAMVFDSARRKYVLFGGSDADPSGRSVFYGDTWEWTGAAWTLVSKTGPPARCHHAMAYDPIRRCTVLVGGYGQAGGDAKTWTWDGTGWKVASAGLPASRVSPRLVWDSKRAKVLLFGGDGSGGSGRDTWAWDGKTWSRITMQGPPARSVHAMAYDPLRGETVLYGGSAGNDVLGDTWRLTGDGWHELGSGGS